MKIAVTSMGKTLDDQVSQRFGRCPYFLLVNIDTMELLEALTNENVAAGGGAGVQSAQLLVNHDVDAILTGNCGPNAFQVFEAAGINVYTGAHGTVRETLEAFKAKTLVSALSANVGSHHGISK